MVEAPKLMEGIILARNPDWGAPSTLVSGRVGSGKTSLLCDIADRLLKRQGRDGRPEEKLFWRGQEECQWKRLADNKVPVKILIPEDTNIEFYGSGANVEYEKIRNFEQLYNLADFDLVNVVYLDFRELASFMRWMELHKFREWKSVFVDEVEDFCPLSATGMRWRQNERVSNILSKARKCLLSFYASTQASQTISWMVLKKLMSQIFLMGAVKSRISPVWQQAIHNLRMGQGYVQVGGQFEKFKFRPFVSDMKIRANIDYGKTKGLILPRERDSGQFKPYYKIEEEGTEIIE